MLPFGYFLKDLWLPILVMLSVSTYCDGLVQLVFKHESSNLLRFFTGIASLPSALAILIKTISS